MYTARRVATQANAAGGAIVVDITCAAGQMMRIESAYAANSGTNTLQMKVHDGDNAMRAYLANVGSAASNYLSIPSPGAAASASGNLVDSKDLYVLAGEKFTIMQGAAGAQNDTMTIAVVIELYGSAAEPTWSKARSTNEANVTLAASTISAANTLLTVVDQT